MENKDYFNLKEFSKNFVIDNIEDYFSEDFKSLSSYEIASEITERHFMDGAFVFNNQVRLNELFEMMQSSDDEFLIDVVTDLKDKNCDLSLLTILTEPEKVHLFVLAQGVEKIITETMDDMEIEFIDSQMVLDHFIEKVNNI